MTDAQQVAMVRLRLDCVPFKVVRRGDFAGPQPGGEWPLHEDSCVVFCRTTMQPGERAPMSVVLSTIQCGYILSDGIEQRVYDGVLMQAAMALRGFSWMAGGVHSMVAAGGGS